MKAKEDIDIAVSRILSVVLRSPKLKGYEFSFNPDLEAHAAITRQSAAEGTVLLKNNNALPLASNQTVALFGIRSYSLFELYLRQSYSTYPYLTSTV